MKKLWQNKWLRISSFAFILFILIAAIFIVVSTIQKSQEKSKDLSENYEQLVEDYEQILEEKDQLQESISISNEKIEQYEKDFVELEQEIQSKQEMIEELQNEINKLKEEIEQLKDLQANKPPASNNTGKSGNLKDLNISTDKQAARKVFLTFDDGPSTLTPSVLDILGEANVPASFFVVGKQMEKYPHIVQRAYREGHSILTHSYSHDYAMYTTFDTFYNDLNKAEQVYEKILNVKPPTIFRFAGGSSNHSSFNYGGEQFMPQLTVDVKERNYTYVDWNVSSGDAGANRNNPSKMLQDIKNQSKGKDFIVLLFHDTAPNTGLPEILPDVIKFYHDNGYAFRSFRDITSDELNIMEKYRIANKPIVR